MRRTSRCTPSVVVACLAAAGLLGGLVGGPQAAGAQPEHERHRAHGHDAGRHMEHRFDDPERYAQSFDAPERDAWQMPEQVIAALEIAPGAAVADIGAGTGYFTVRLARDTAAGTVYAVDIEPAMVDYVRRRADEAGLGNVVGVVADPDSPNLPAPVDLVLIVNTYHHIRSGSPTSARCGTTWRPAGASRSSTPARARPAAARPTSSALRRKRSPTSWVAPIWSCCPGRTFCRVRTSSSSACSARSGRLRRGAHESLPPGGPAGRGSAITPGVGA